MTLLLLAGIVVLAAVQLATVIYYVKLGMEQEKQVQIVDGLLTGLTVCLILRLEGLWMQCGLFVGYLMLRYVAEVYKGSNTESMGFLPACLCAFRDAPG